MRVLASAFALLCSISSAFADPSGFNRFMAFGDSLQDNGNLYINTLGLIPKSPPYDQRFSNGPTWIEILTNPANPANAMNRFWANSGPLFSVPSYVIIGNVNAAVGGAQASGDHTVFILTIPGADTQIQTYLGAGGTFGPRDLVSIQGGANDFFYGSHNPTGVAAADLNNIALVASRGAGTILVSNLPNIAITPGEQGNASAAQFSQAYNAALNQGTQALAANPLYARTNFVQMDWYSALNVILANPSAFGFTNVTDACQPGTFGIPSGPTCAHPDSYLFWDGVHPSEVAQRLLARYAALLLSTEETGQAVRALGQAGLSNRLDASDIIFRRGATPGAQKPAGAYAEIIGSTASFNGTNTATYGSTSYDYSLGGVRAGFDGNSGPVSFGSSFAYQSGSLSGHALSANIDTAQIDAYALRRFSRFFAGLEGGVSFSNYGKIRRATGFPTVTGEGGTNGIDYSGDATVGAQFQFGGITLTPAARVGYASVNIDGFTESAPILALQYGNQDIDTGFWTARVRAATSLFRLPNAVFWGEIGYEGLFAASDSYQAKLAFNTAHAVTIGDAVEGRGFFLKTGVGGFVYDGIKLSGEYELSTQNGAGDIQSGRLRVTIPLQSEFKE